MNYSESLSNQPAAPEVNLPQALSKKVLLGVAIFILLLAVYGLVFFYGSPVTLSKQQVVRLPYNWKLLTAQSEPVAAPGGVKIETTALPFDVIYDTTRYADSDVRTYVNSQIKLRKTTSEKAGIVFIQTQSFPDASVIDKALSASVPSSATIKITANKQRKTVESFESPGFFTVITYSSTSKTIAIARVNYASVLEKQILAQDFAHITAL